MPRSRSQPGPRTPPPTGLRIPATRTPSAGLAALWIWVTSVTSACQTEPMLLPTEAAVQALDRNSQPPLYQLLYDAPTLPGSREDQQRVRLLIWIRHMDLDRTQLDRLDSLRLLALERRERLVEAELATAGEWEARENEVYDRLWAALAAGAPVDAPEMAELTDALRELRGGGERERQLLSLRLEGARSIMEAERTFLNTLTPRQESLLADSLFFLRHRLDPVGNPGDFRALVGSIYDPGEYAVLSRGSSDFAKEPLNIGALWSDEPMLEGHELHEARREVLLYLALMEPGLDQAITAARALRAAPASPGAQGTPPQ